MMKHTCIFSLFLAVLFALAAPAGEQREISLREKQEQARKLAEEVLTGRELRVRVYNNWREDPKEYKHVSVRLDGLSFGHNAVKAAFGGISKSAVLVVAGQDQTDEAVTAMTADFVCGSAYGADKKLSIWPSLSNVRDHKDCVFTDALGYPIPKATVEMLVRGHFADSREIYLGGAVLDEEGRLSPPILGGGIYRYIFVISHPRYGKAAVENRPSSRKPDDYDDSVARYVVPLVPMDSEAASRAIQGYVVDTEVNGIKGVSVECDSIRTTKDSGIRAHTRTHGRSITNEQGWFAMYAPIDKDGVLSEDILPVNAEYYLRITPPKPFMPYEHRRRGVPAGGAELITLASVSRDEYFHTFKFQDDQGMITELRELQKIEVRHTQDEREWQGLKYDEWKDGCYLQKGTLHASMRRWEENFNFKPIKVTDDSPEELVFKTYETIIYRGRVIDALTGEPMPKVFVLVDHSYSRKDPSALTPQHWERLYMQAAEESAAGPLDKKLYEYRDRVTVTDANGCYELVFMPGFTTQLWTFKAVEKGFVPKPADASRWKPNANGIVEVPTIELLNPEAMKATHLPVLVFEDPSGTAITDPNILDHIRFKINVGDGSRRECPLSTLMNSRRLTPGIYQPTVDWEDCHYVFEQVEVTEDSPQEIVFNIKEVGLPEVTYRGRVIHGITGTPMRGAIVMSQNALDEGDASGIRPEQWEAIHSMGPEFDPNNQALTPLRQAFGYQKITRADAAGQFQLTVERKETPMRGRLITTEQDYLGTRQKLSYTTPIDKDSPEPIRYKEFEPDENGHVTLPPMKLFPAGTIIIEPNIPYVQGSREEAWFHFRTAEDDPTPWLNDFWATPRSTMGGGVVYRYTLRPRYVQRVYVPAGVELTLRIAPRQSQRAPVTIGGVKLEQGQVHDLGRVDFPETFKVAVKVINSAGEPVKGVRVLCQGADGFVSGLRSITDESGMVKLDVAPYSNGQFIVRYFDKSTRENIREGIAYEVSGEQDAGKQFTLQISDEMLYQLFK